MFNSIKDTFSQISGLIRPHLTGKTAFLKRKIYGDYVTVKHYKTLLSICLFLDFIFISSLEFTPNLVKYFTHNTHWTMLSKWHLIVLLIILLIFLMFFVSITYNLIMYPHMYKRDRLPICTYFESYPNSSKSHLHKVQAIVLDMTQNEALVRDIVPNNIKNNKIESDDYSNERLVNLNNIKIYHNCGIYQIENESPCYKDNWKSKSELRSELRYLRSTIHSCKSQINHLKSIISSMKSNNASRNYR